jgi:polyphosphate kinase 2 (PPK2 family)
LLEIVNLDQKLKKAEWKARRPAYQQRLYDLQKAAFDAQMPTVVLFEGWDAAGKGTCVQTLTSRLDPRGFTVWRSAARPTNEASLAVAVLACCRTTATSPSSTGLVRT